MSFCCKLCNMVLPDRRSFASHLSRTHRKDFSSDLERERFLVYAIYGEDIVEKTVASYINCEYAIYQLPIQIAKFIELLGVKRSSKEERSTARYKEKYLKSIQTKYGMDITNISQSDIVKIKKKESLAETYGTHEKYVESRLDAMKIGYEEYIKDKDRVASTQSKIQNTCLEKYGHPNFGQGEIAKEKASKTKKETIESWDYEERLARTSKARESVCHRGGYSSKPEKRIRKILIDLEIESQYNKHMWNYNWDLVFGDRYIIEVQGTMWHAKPTKYKENDLIMGKILAKDIWVKDSKKHKKAQEEGYIVIEIWEDDIGARSDSVLEEYVKQKLIEVGYEF